jgi:hypothetical protein
MGSSVFRLPVAFSPDGALVVGGSLAEERNEKRLLDKGGYRLWEAATGKQVAYLKPGSQPIPAVSHPDNRFVATNLWRDGVQVWDAVTGQVIASRRMPHEVYGRLGGHASCLAFSPDGRLMATGLPDGTILLWDIALPADRPEPLAPKEIDSLWADLKEEDAARAWRAVWRMSQFPAEALTLLRDRLRPFAGAPADVTQPLLVELDHDDFARREKATQRLREMGSSAVPALRQALEGNPSVEQRRRMEKLLAEVAPPLSPEALQRWRAVTVLERINSPEARQVLERLTTSAETPLVTRQAEAALVRMK